MNENNSDKLSLPQALDLIKDREKESFCLEKVNLAELLHTAFKKGHWSVEKGTFGAQKRTA